MGNIIGGGIFLLPASVAPYGTISLVAFGILTAGAIALALVFGRLAERHPRTGGPYVYAREAFGDFAGFLAAWSYWITAWVSNAALAVAAVGYLGVLLLAARVGGRDARGGAVPPVAAGARQPRRDPVRRCGQLVSTVLKFVPLLLVAWAGCSSSTRRTWARSGRRRRRARRGVGVRRDPALQLPGRRVRRRQRGGGARPARATSGGPPSWAPSARPSSTCWARSRCSAPSPTTGSWTPRHPSPTRSTPCSAAPGVSAAIACMAVLSMLGALNGWTLLSAQTPYAAARDGLFPRSSRGAGGACRRRASSSPWSSRPC